MNHDSSEAKKAAHTGPDVITDRGRPSHVLMTFEKFERLIGKRHNFVDALSMSGLSTIDFQSRRKSSPLVRSRSREIS
ncbi:type II toxin-antitoxin system Phd/YefM family antitoxin, partial [Chryseobacterium sp. SIMBA_028]|uniref:type II toxin-antitoxin system Phd/YefM family antitoxin n=1 Tax=Chryseobacterium sp. SIMBA_028 TaxID=3085771 RepID=UPI0039793C35